MREVLDRAGPRLRSLADGETGERKNWIVHILEGLRNHPDLEVAKDGNWSNYKDQIVYKVRKGHTFDGSGLDLGHVASYDQSRPVFDSLRAEFDLPKLAYQVGVPGDLDLALFTFGIKGPLRHRAAFTDATMRTIRKVQSTSEGDVVFQLEIPAELVFVTKVPGFAQQLMANRLAVGVVRLAERSPEGTRFGIHLCLGDLDHKALGKMKNASPLVSLANAIAAKWPAGRTLEFMHAPLAAGEEPPVMSPQFYRPLTGLRLPAATRFVAGLLHEGRSIEEQKQVLSIVESSIGRTVGVAAACGLGRRTPDAARATLEQGLALTESGD